MENMELSFTFDEFSYERDFTADNFEFECLWAEYAEEMQRVDEFVDLEQRFAKQLTISDTS